MKVLYKILILAAFGTTIGGICVYFFKGTSDQVIAASIASSKVTEADWIQLQSLDVTTGNIPDSLRPLNGVNIKIPGFIIPLEDNQDFVDEFLFVPSPMACIHVPPPPPNQIIHVKMASGKKAKMSYGPVWLVGKFVISENSGKKIRTSFEMIGSYTQPYM
jgi:uncharacterized protein